MGDSRTTLDFASKQKISFLNDQRQHRACGPRKVLRSIRPHRRPPIQGRHHQVEARQGPREHVGAHQGWPRDQGEVEVKGINGASGHTNGWEILPKQAAAQKGMHMLVTLLYILLWEGTALY